MFGIPNEQATGREIGRMKNRSAGKVGKAICRVLGWCGHLPPACPAARVKRASPEGLPASPMFTRVLGMPIGKSSIYWHPRLPVRKRLTDKGSRSDRAETPKRHGIRKEDLGTWKGFCSAIMG